MVFDLPYKGAFLEADFTDASQAPLGAGQGHAITVCLGGDEPFTTAAANLCISGKAAVYLWGTIIYEDVFRNEHRTHIRAISSGENFSTGEFEICEEGNEAD